MKKTNKKVEQEEYLDIEELFFLMESAENYYNNLKNFKEQMGDEAFYTFVTISILKDYRKTLEIKVKTMLLSSYKEVVRAIINHDEEFIVELINFIENGEKEDGYKF